MFGVCSLLAAAFQLRKLCAAAAAAAAAGVGAKNVFDNVIVIADEVHNLLIHLNSNQCKLLLHQVHTATNPTMIGLAGTPLLRPPALDAFRPLHEAMTPCSGDKEAKTEVSVYKASGGYNSE